MEPAIHCPTCGYNLTGLPENRCPECGTAFKRDQLILDRAACLQPIYRTELLLLATAPVGCAWLLFLAIWFFTHISLPGMIVVLTIALGMNMAAMAWAAWAMTNRVVTHVWFARHHRPPLIAVRLSTVAVAILVYCCELIVVAAPLVLIP